MDYTRAQERATRAINDLAAALTDATKENTQACYAQALAAVDTAIHTGVTYAPPVWFPHAADVNRAYTDAIRAARAARRVAQE